MTAVAAEEVEGVVVAVAEAAVEEAAAATLWFRPLLRRRKRQPCRLQTIRPQRWPRYAISVSECISTSVLH